MRKWAGSTPSPCEGAAGASIYGEALVAPPGVGVVSPQWWFALSLASVVVVIVHIVGSRSVLVAVRRASCFWSFRVRGGFVAPYPWFALSVGFVFSMGSYLR